MPRRVLCDRLIALVLVILLLTACLAGARTGSTERFIPMDLPLKRDSGDTIRDRAGRWEHDLQPISFRPTAVTTPPNATPTPPNATPTPPKATPTPPKATPSPSPTPPKATPSPTAASPPTRFAVPQTLSKATFSDGLTNAPAVPFVDTKSYVVLRDEVDPWDEAKGKSEAPGGIWRDDLVTLKDVANIAALRDGAKGVDLTGQMYQKFDFGAGTRAGSIVKVFLFMVRGPSVPIPLETGELYDEGVKFGGGPFEHLRFIFCYDTGFFTPVKTVTYNHRFVTVESGPDVVQLYMSSVHLYYLSEALDGGRKPVYREELDDVVPGHHGFLACTMYFRLNKDIVKPFDRIIRPTGPRYSKVGEKDVPTMGLLAAGWESNPNGYDPLYHVVTGSRRAMMLYPKQYTSIPTFDDNANVPHEWYFYEPSQHGDTEDRSASWKYRDEWPGGTPIPSVE